MLKQINNSKNLYHALCRIFLDVKILLNFKAISISS